MLANEVLVFNALLFAYVQRIPPCCARAPHQSNGDLVHKGLSPLFRGIEKIPQKNQCQDIGVEGFHSLGSASRAR
jgi:hypothetical protein